MQIINKNINEKSACSCCADEPIFKPETKEVEIENVEHSHDHDHDHNHGEEGESHVLLIIALLVLVVMLTLEYGFNHKFSSLTEGIIYGFAYLLSGYKVLYIAYKKAKHLDFFNEFFLMSVATIGAFSIGSFSEGVAVMVFYSIGEWFQESAVNKAKRNIKALLDIRPDTVELITPKGVQVVNPRSVKIGDIIEIKPGAKVALDGVLLSETATFNTAALTGESVPDDKQKGDTVLAGMINLNQLIQVEVKSLFADSKLSKILEMVQDATARKSKTQLFISRFAKVYTPIVFALSVLVIVLPMLFVDNYVFTEWLYRGLVFLVISCPCALVVSIPLGYFGGIGLASKNGILFKGSNYLDVMTTIDSIVMDKTGTLTKGVFTVQKVVSETMDEKSLINIAAAIESKSTHPIAQAIVTYAGDDYKNTIIEHVEEIAGHGLKGQINGQLVYAGNTKLLKKMNISFPTLVDEEVDSIVVLAINNQYAGYILVADEIKEDASQAIQQMHALGLKTYMLSGDKDSVVQKVAKALNINYAYGNLLPEDKVMHVEKLKGQNLKLAFVGDGVNDAPVIALADVGIAMGGLGSDATIETADVVIQNDQPHKIVQAVKIGKLTRQIVWQNIVLAMGIKILVLVLGAGGIATLWEAVIADVGVALLAILNAVRIQNRTV